MTAEGPDPQSPPEGPTIRADLAHRSSQNRLRNVRLLVGAIVGGMLLALFLGLWVWRVAFSGLPPIPSKAALWSMNRPPGVLFLDREGKPIGQRGFKHGAPVALTSLPAYVPKAFLAAEDRRFYHHPGVDPVAMVRALRADLKAHRFAEGASTITQQVARGVFLTSDQTLKRKLQEAALALRIEALMSKDEILTLYLNRTYFGAGAYGIEAASHVYFAKPASQLTLSEAAVLAALPKAPTRLDPSTDLSAAITRSHLVLHRMRGEGWLTAKDEAAAVAARPRLAQEPAFEGDYGYVLDLAQAEARRLAPGSAPDLVVRLTIDPALQAEAVRALKAGVSDAQARGATEGAIVALGLQGDVLALSGGLDHRESPFNRATQAKRQPGSAFKPFVYAAALEAGLSPDDVRSDTPVRYGDYAPSNSDGVYRGSVSLTDALSHSINTVAVRLTHELGPARVASLARRFGVDGMPYDPSLPIALGAYEVSLIDITGGYQVIQSGGKLMHPWLIAEIASARGDILWRRNPVPPQLVYDPGRASTLTRMMQQVIEAPGATGHHARLDRPAAGKTGTSQNNRDAWFIGFTPDLVCGVWIGDDHNHPMRGMAGGETPALIWRDFMMAAHRKIAPHDFGETPQTDPLATFYTELTSDFSRAASEEDAPLNLRP